MSEDLTAHLPHLRRLLEDVPHAESELATANGDEQDFHISNPPIVDGSEVVTVDAMPQVNGLDYTVESAGDVPGRIVFTIPPENGSAVRIEYLRQSWDDVELLGYLNAAAVDWADNAVGLVYSAGVLALDTLLAGSASALQFGSGEESFDMPGVFDRLTRLRAILAGHVALEERRPYLLAAASEESA